MNDAASSLETFEMLQGVSAAARRELARDAAAQTLAPGELLIRQGDPGKAMYFVLTGELGVSLNDPAAEAIAVIHAGETVGELALLTSGTASAHVVARSECSLLALDEEGFWAFVQASHPFSINLLVKLADRLRASNTTVSTNIDKRRLYERAAMFDGLTGIHNRRWLDENLTRLVERAERSEGHLCVALIDIDHFKGFNDGHGHDAGDAVLSNVASTMARSLRPTDLVARFGGEEFVILFPDTRAQSAVIAAERVRAVVADAPQAMPDGKALPRVTISMGVAEHKKGQKPAELLKAADEAMYRAKHAGRNRVMAAE